MSKRQFLRLVAITQLERIGMIDRVSEAINRSGAWITDFHLYSNALICINFEVPIADLGRLVTSLQETGLHLDQESIDQLTPVHEPASKQEELVGTLQITFVHSEPDLYRAVPAVPG